MKWLFLSFVSDSGFIGGMYVQEDSDGLLKYPSWCVDIEGAPSEITQILIAECPPEQVPTDHDYHNRLLSRAELETLHPVASVGEIKAILGASGKDVV
jgi:hypothetical protein